MKVESENPNENTVERDDGLDKGSVSGADQRKEPTLGDQPIRTEQAFEEPSLGAKRNEQAKTEKDEYEIPKSLTSKYLMADQRFYYRNHKDKVAFEDRGKKMVTEYNDPDVAKSIVDLVEAKGWTKIKVTGHDDFKREVWLEAKLRGIEITGYKPKESDLAKLSEMRSNRMVNSVEEVLEKIADKAPVTKTTEKESGKEAEEPSKKDSRRGTILDEFFKEPDVINGKLLAHGQARYEFNETNDLSYFVKVETDRGTKTYWGVDLERGIASASVAVGDRVNLERAEKTPVTVKENVRDDDGRVVDTREVDAKRTTWKVSKEGQEAEKIPELEGEYRVPAAVLLDVLKSKGYSEKALNKAMLEASKRLDTMAKEGKPAPGVKIHDKDAPREMERPRVQGKSKQVEKERAR